MHCRPLATPCRPRRKCRRTHRPPQFRTPHRSSDTDRASKPRAQRTRALRSAASKSSTWLLSSLNCFEVSGQVTHLFVLTHAAQTVLPDEVPNLEQGGLRGLLRVVGAEYPYMRTTQVDVDDATDAEHLALQLLSGSDEDETAWRRGAWYVARLCQAPLSPEDRRMILANHDRDGMRLHIRTPGDLQALELVGYQRVSPGPGQIEVAISTSSVNFADVLVSMGLFPEIEGGCRN